MTRTPPTPETPKAPPPLDWLRPPAPWGRWSGLMRAWVARVRESVPPEHREGACRAVALLRELLDLEKTPDNGGRPAARLRQPGDDTEEGGEG